MFAISGYTFTFSNGSSTVSVRISGPAGKKMGLHLGPAGGVAPRAPLRGCSWTVEVRAHGNEVGSTGYYDGVASSRIAGEEAIQSILIEVDGSVFDLYHSMIGQPDQIHGQLGFLDAFCQLSNLSIEFVDGFGEVRTIGTIAVASCVRGGEIEGNHVRTLFRRKTEPVERLRDSLFCWENFRQISGSNRDEHPEGPPPNVPKKNLPKKRCGPHALLLCQHPKRNSAVPRPIGDRLRVMIAVDFVSRRIIKVIGDDAHDVPGKARSQSCNG
jgi:hypothetical protein